MRDRRKRNIIIGVLCSLLVFMGIGYSVISGKLSITGVSKVTGKFDVYIDSINSISKGTGKSVQEVIDKDKLSLKFETKLYAPGDSVTYDIVIKNSGSIAAKLNSYTKNITGNADGYINYKVNLEDGIILQPGEKYSFTIVSEFDSSVEFIDPNKTMNAILDLKLNFVQYSSDSFGPSPGAVVLYNGYANTDHTVTWQYYDDGSLVISGNGPIVSHDGSYSTTSSQESYDETNFASKIIASAIMENYNRTVSDLFPVGSEANVHIPEDIVSEDMEYFTLFCLTSDTYIQKLAEREEIPGVTNREGLFNFVETQMGMSMTEVKAVCNYIPQIKAIIIDEGVTAIGNGAFYEIGYGNQLTIPSTVTVIRSSAFSHNAITGLTFAGAEDGTSQLNRIEYEAFENNYSIGSIYLPGSLTYLASASFREAGITGVVVNGHYDGDGGEFSNYAFNNNPQLTQDNFTLGNDTSFTQETLTQYYQDNRSRIMNDGS